MEQAKGLEIALKSVARGADIASIFEDIYEVTFSLRAGGVEGTITVPISALDGSDTETVLKARLVLHHVFMRLAEEAIAVPAAKRAAAEGESVR